MSATIQDASPPVAARLFIAKRVQIIHFEINPGIFNINLPAGEPELSLPIQVDGTALSCVEQRPDPH